MSQFDTGGGVTGSTVPAVVGGWFSVYVYPPSQPPPVSIQPTNTPKPTVYPKTPLTPTKAAVVTVDPQILTFGDWESNNDDTVYDNGWTYYVMTQRALPLCGPFTSESPSIPYPTGGTWDALNHVLYDAAPDDPGRHQVLWLQADPLDLNTYNEIRLTGTCATAISLLRGGEGVQTILTPGEWVAIEGGLLSVTADGYIDVADGGAPASRWTITNIEIRFNPTI